MAHTPSFNRFVTGHDNDGNSIFLYEGPIVPFGTKASDGNTLTHAAPWSTADPPNLSDDTDTQTIEYTTLNTGEGSTARFAAFPPHMKGLMHRTATLDYVVIQKGEVVLELEGGGERLCKEGDAIVQRGTNHAWHNRTDKPCQFFAVLITAPLPKVNGKQLEANRK